MYELDKIVKEMLETHIGGEVFFDHLDEAVRTHTPIVDELLGRIPNISEQHIIVSGKFGVFFKQYLDMLNIRPKSLITVQGGLRVGNKANLSEDTPKNTNMIFIDDSFYSGKTKNVIDSELRKLGSNIETTYVIYDGSRKKQENVKSLYRYYK